MRVSALFAAAACSSVAYAQGTVNLTYVTGLANALTALNLTSLVTAVTTVANSSAGVALLTKLQSGQKFTILAPTNGAFSGVNPFFGNDPKWLGQALAYHVLPGNVNLYGVKASPDSSTFPTALSDPTLVKLKGGATQSVAFSRVGNSTYVANENSPVRIVKSTTYQNLRIYVVSAVLDLPPSLTYALTLQDQGLSADVSTLVGALGAFPSILSAVENSKSVTIFAPNNAAFTNAGTNGVLPAGANATYIQTLLVNHVINGTVVFYNGQAQKNYTSVGNQQITVGSGGRADGTGGVVYYKGLIVANIVRPNIITQNGVVHLIDEVIPNPKAKPAQRRRRSNSRLFANLE